MGYRVRAIMASTPAVVSGAGAAGEAMKGRALAPSQAVGNLAYLFQQQPV
jgi:hypothetical protein